MSLTEAEVMLRTLLQSWQSRFKYTVTFLSQTKRVIKFKTTWSRRPTPHEPLPNIRVDVLFALRYDRKDVHMKSPQVSFRIAHEDMVHTDLQNIDHHILRNLKFQTCLQASNPLKLEHGTTYNTRTLYNPLETDTYPERRLKGFPGIEDEQKKSPKEVEQFLVKMFQQADLDENGVLDIREFNKLMKQSNLGFKDEDLKSIFVKHDLNADGVLVYREFIPIAIDLLQAQKALTQADELVLKRTGNAYTKALKRIQSSQGLPRMMDITLSSLDPDEYNSIPLPKLQEFLDSLDIELSAKEVQYVLRQLKPDEKEPDRLIYKQFQSTYESVLLDALQESALDREATDVELYLRELLEARDTDHSGTLSRDVVIDVLSNLNRIELSTVQIFAIAGSIVDKVKYKPFCRKAAVMVYKLFESGMSEKMELLNRTSYTPIELHGARSRVRIQLGLKQKFVEFDANNNDVLEPSEFYSLMADTSLCVGSKEIQDLFEQADTNKDGVVDWSEFLEFGYSNLLHLARDAALENQFVNVVLRQKDSEREQDIKEAKLMMEARDQLDADASATSSTVQPTPASVPSPTIQPSASSAEILLK